jgi:HEAT repeat protein
MQEQISIKDRLASEQSDLRAAALAELLQSGADLSPHVEAVAACLGDPTESHRFLALQLLANIGASATAFIALALSRKQPESLRAAAAAIIAGMGPMGARAVPALCRNLPSPDETLRNAAALALAKIGADSVPALRLVLSTSDPGAVSAAIDALTRIGRPAEAAVPDVAALAATAPPQLQLACAAALVCLTGNPDRGLPLLLNALTHEDPLVRKAAVERIAMLGTCSHSAISNLVQSTMDPNDSVRTNALLALGRIRSPFDAIYDSVASRLGDPSAEVRYAAAVVLAGYGETARRALPNLRACLQDPVEKVAMCATGAIKKIESPES